MTDMIARQVLAEELIAKWVLTLGLADWDVRYSEDPPEADTPSTTLQAQLEMRPSEKVAAIKLDPELPLEAVESCILHELLHLVLKPFTIPVQRILIHSVRGALLSYANDELHGAEEEVIETLMRAFGMPRFVPYGDLANDWRAFSD